MAISHDLLYQKLFANQRIFHICDFILVKADLIFSAILINAWVVECLKQKAILLWGGA